jgi:trans-aconitate 2-methyltransferase
MSGAGKYRWDAAEYARSSAAQQGWALELIGKLGLAGSETVLDIGCGDGKVTAEIARRVPAGRIVGIDSSDDMIRMSRETFPPAAAANLTFELADARQLMYEGIFDVAFSSATLHWVKDHAPVLQGVARALKPGGRLLFQMGGRGNGAEIFTVADDMMRDAAWRPFFAGFVFPWGFYGPEEYAPWCTVSGLRSRRIELLPRAMKQKGVDGLAGWIRTTWMPYTARLPEDRREPFIREAAARFIALHPLDAEGNATVGMVRLEVEAVKQ